MGTDSQGCSQGSQGWLRSGKSVGLGILPTTLKSFFPSPSRGILTIVELEDFEWPKKKTTVKNRRNLFRLALASDLAKKSQTPRAKGNRGTRG